MLTDNMNIEIIDPSQLNDLISNPPTDSNKKIYISIFGRQHFVKRKDGKEFNVKDYEENPDLYEPCFHQDYMKYLSVLVISIGWVKGT